MLLRFRVSNFLSIRDEQELSLIALDEHSERAEVPVPRSGDSVLPVAAVFGANASGKSNVVHALGFMRDAVLKSHQSWKPDTAVPRQPFLLGGADRADPSTFVVDIAVEGIRYEYGFAVDDRRVTHEWLYSFPEGRPRRLYEREADRPIRFGPSLKGRRALVADVVRPNSLFLSAAAANNHPQLLPLYRWFSSGCNLATEGNAADRFEHTLQELENHRDALLSLLRYADFGISDIEVENQQMPAEQAEKLVAAVKAIDPARADTLDPQQVTTSDIRLTHTPGGASLPLRVESSGTRTWLELLGPVVSFLRRGACLVIDELDARLHPDLAAKLVALFQDPGANSNGAQLVFNTHDVTLLRKTSAARLHRDQIWLTEKDEDGVTRLFPLTEYRVRDTLDDVEGRYLAGRYGGVPFFDEDLLAGLSEGSR